MTHTLRDGMRKLRQHRKGDEPMHPGFAIGAVLAVSVIAGFVFHITGDGTYGLNDIEHGERKARQLFATLEPGTPVEAVTAALGAPDFIDLFTVDDQTWRVLRYRTHRVHADGDTTRDETTALVFRDGRLIGVGPEALSRLPGVN